MLTKVIGPSRMQSFPTPDIDSVSAMKEIACTGPQYNEVKVTPKTVNIADCCYLFCVLHLTDMLPEETDLKMITPEKLYEQKHVFISFKLSEEVVPFLYMP